MVKWEYRLTRINLKPEHYTDVTATLNSLGEDGWEVAGLIPILGQQELMHVLLKRQKR